MNKLYLILLLFLPLLAQGQSKITASTAVWPELQLNYSLGKHDILFLQNQYRINADAHYNDLKESGPLRYFERVELAMGYEHTFSEHWRGGAILRYAAEDFPKTLFYTLFLRHNGHVGSLYFNKQAAFEYADQEARDGFGRFRLEAVLGRRFPIRRKFITPSVSYEALLLTEFGKNKPLYAERVIDRTRLRFSLNYELTEKLRINPYFMRQTDYYYVQIPPKYNKSGQLQEDGYTTMCNRISPVAGLELRYSFNIKPNPANITY